MTVPEIINNEGSWAYQCQDVLEFAKTLPDNCIHSIITSPPYYGLRSYMPNLVRLKSSLSPEKRAEIEKELRELGILPDDHI